jgi:hypothetical protein
LARFVPVARIESNEACVFARQTEIGVEHLKKVAHLVVALENLEHRIAVVRLAFLHPHLIA